ncbi:MBL fold metallo-hydrolase [Hallella bergensis]|uniref:MBL fold metallo-hydrolase n=1 Tax=Hallella bergensis TaxID=242750 RepID=UPI0023F4855A|nr:MBL fold metallo-hydrolase [Hallella bergensis]
MKFRFLGTGTSNGVPVIGCDCAVCKSNNRRDKRSRTAAMLETETTRVLIDCGPDIRMQLMPLEFRKIDAVLLTHEHYDHAGGIDDLRPCCYFGNIDIYGNDMTVKAVKHNFPYCFTEHLYPGVPKLTLHAIRKHEPMRVGDINILPIEVMHGKLPILGYRFGSMAYITDMKAISPDECVYLQGVETLVLNALRWVKPHHSHLIIPEAIDFSRRIGASRTFLTHLTHKIGLHEVANDRLPEGFQFAYDGLEIDV